MQTHEIGKTGVQGSRLAYGCMRIVGDGSPGAREKGKAAVRAALEAGYTHFDHADIYAAGASEELFAEVLRDEPGCSAPLVFIQVICLFPASSHPACLLAQAA